ncbi:MAG TPA: TRAP transporter large permease subunit [Alphaproteobacteria bacterium]|nr:TRAP transporter large permease subunit [Alphaproteobacteria bacterium]
MLVTELLDVLMFVAVCAMLMTGFPVAFALAGTALLFALIGHALGVFDLRFIAFLPQRVFGTMANDVLIAVPLFIFMGIMLERSKVAEELLENMGRLFGGLRGGLGISVSVVGALLAASTGIVGATVVTMGLLSLPVMLRHGYDARLACGSICAAGTLGQIIPPSIVLVLLGDVISSSYQAAQLEQGVFNPDVVSVGDLFAGALLPGLLLVGLYILYQIAVAFLRPESSPALPADATTDGTGRLELYGRLLRVLAAPVVLIVAVLGSILAGIATPTEAAGVGALGATLLAGLKLERRYRRAVLPAVVCLAAVLVLTGYVDLRVARQDIPAGEWVGIAVAILLCVGVAWGVAAALFGTWRTGVLTAVVRSTARITAMVFLIVIGAALFALVFRGLGGDETVRDFLTGIPGGPAGATLVVMATMFLLGFFLDFVEIVFVVVPIVAPVLLAMGIDPVWLGVMMAINLQTSFLTPPFGFALFYLRGVAPDGVRTTDIYRGVAPFVVLQLLALGLLALFPAMATWLPGVVFGG